MSLLPVSSWTLNGCPGVPTVMLMRYLQAASRQLLSVFPRNDISLRNLGIVDIYGHALLPFSQAVGHRCIPGHLLVEIHTEDFGSGLRRGSDIADAG